MPLLVGEVLETSQIPKDIVEALSDRFRFNQEDGRALSFELRARRGLHTSAENLCLRGGPSIGARVTHPDWG